MFIRNCWYVAGWDYDLPAHGLLARRIINQGLVLYRKENGSVAALEDRCCHRAAPLSKGRKEGDCVRCMYHGLMFDASGRCVEVPCQTAVSDKLRVRAFPVVEQDHWIWVWVGEPAMADPALIPRAHGNDPAAWNVKSDAVHFAANYQLVADNLADLSHVSYVHDGTFGGTEKWVTVRPEVTQTERSITVTRWLRNVPPPRFTQGLLGADARVDIYTSFELHLPCTFLFTVNIHGAGTRSEGDSDGPVLIKTLSSQAVTPETEKTSNYYYAWGPSRDTDDSDEVRNLFFDAMVRAFVEDKEMIQAQQKVIDADPQPVMLPIASDRTAALFRWIHEQQLRKETAAPLAA